MRPEDYPANWESSGKGLGLQPPGGVDIPEPARGTPDIQAAEPDTGGVPPGALGPPTQPQSPLSPAPTTTTAQFVTVSGGGTLTEELNVVIIP